MPSAIELSVKFGIPAQKIEAICRYTGWSLDDEDFEVDKIFSHVARSVSRKRASAYALAFMGEYANADQLEFVLGLEPDFRKRYAACEFPVYAKEKLGNASKLIDTLTESKGGDFESEWNIFITWIEATIERAQNPIDHAYIAVRLMLSINQADMIRYPGPIASLMNKARHRGKLDRWFTLESRGDKNAVIYHIPGMGTKRIDPVEYIPDFEGLNISDERLGKALKLCEIHDTLAVATRVALAQNLPFRVQDIEAFLLSKMQKEFDL